MTPGNYLEHAAEWWYDRDIKDKTSVWYKTWLHLYPTALKAPRFLLPDGGICVTADLSYLAAPLRLPYPCTVIEFSLSGQKVALIAREEHDMYGVAVIAIYQVWMCQPFPGETKNAWTPNSVVTLIHQEDYVTGERDTLKKTLWDMIDNKEDTKRESHWLADTLQSNCPTSVLGLIQVLQCCNVKTEVVPAPGALNKKRLARHKLPFVEYKILTVAQPQSISAGVGGGSHASPRQHLRRGHIRRLPDTRTVWVHQCMVGDPRKGTIVKDYRVTV